MSLSCFSHFFPAVGGGQDNAAVPYNETVLFVGEVDLIQICLRTAALEFPRFSAIFGVQDFSKLRGHPAGFVVDKVERV